MKLPALLEAILVASIYIIPNESF